MKESEQQIIDNLSNRAYPVNLVVTTSGISDKNKAMSALCNLVGTGRVRVRRVYPTNSSRDSIKLYQLNWSIAKPDVDSTNQK